MLLISLLIKKQIIQLQSEFDYIVTVLVRVHDGEEGDALGILEDFKNKLRTSKGRRYLNEYFKDASLLSTSGVSLFPSLMITDFEETSRLSLEFWVRSTIVDETIDVIENVELSGEVYEDYDQPNSPININIKAP